MPDVNDRGEQAASGPALLGDRRAEVQRMLARVRAALAAAAAGEAGRAHEVSDLLEALRKWTEAPGEEPPSR